MVHALDEIYRVLTPRGVLVDVRPVGSAFDVDVWKGGSARKIGRCRRGDNIRSDAECSEASGQVLRDGKFTIMSTALLTTYNYATDAEDDIGPVAISESQKSRIRPLLGVEGAQMRARFENALTIYCR